MGRRGAAGGRVLGLSLGRVWGFLSGVKFRFQFRRYRLPWRVPVRTAHGWWTEREGVIVRLQGEAGFVGWGEAAPIPWFGTETCDEVEAACRDLGEWVEAGKLDQVPARLGCLRGALAAARTGIGKAENRESGKSENAGGTGERKNYLGVAALLPAGRGVLGQIAMKAEMGFRVFKWKVGVGDIADELALFDDVCAALPAGGKVRLDANGAWDRRRAERWLERCVDRPVEYVEQPTPAKTDVSMKDEMDLLLGLAGDWPVMLALDESLTGEGDVERWLGAGWPGVWVVKPGLVGDVAGVTERLAKDKTAKGNVVFSSALETAVGAQTALRAAFAWADRDTRTPARALGFGVWPLFADGRFDGPQAMPFIRREDVERIDPEAVWTALS